MASNRRHVAGIYAKPILGDIQSDPAKVLRLLKRDLNTRLKSKIQDVITHPAYSDKVKHKLAKSIQIQIKKSSIVVTTNFLGFFPLLKGRKAHQMEWLTKAKRPIPIRLDDGTMIFRWASPRSMSNGSWWHPGYRPTNLIDLAREETRKFVKDRLKKVLMQQLKSVLSGGGR